MPSPALTLTCAVSVWFEPTGFVAVCGVIWMFASTNVLTASPEFGATPSVATVNGPTPPTEAVEVACPVTLPAVGEVNMIVHWPAALVFAPASSQVLARRRYVRGTVRVGQRDVDVLTGGGHEAGAVPRSFTSVTVKVCGDRPRWSRQA